VTFRFEDFLASVRGLVVARIGAVARAAGFEKGAETIFSGKMLRTRLAGRIAAEGGRVDAAVLIELCAATELLHLASLCHDDVIDNALLRRHQDALWVSAGPSTAVLMEIGRAHV